MLLDARPSKRVQQRSMPLQDFYIGSRTLRDYSRKVNKEDCLSNSLLASQPMLSGERDLTAMRDPRRLRFRVSESYHTFLAIWEPKNLPSPSLFPIHHSPVHPPFRRLAYVLPFQVPESFVSQSVGPLSEYRNPASGFYSDRRSYRDDRKTTRAPCH